MWCAALAASAAYRNAADQEGETEQQRNDVAEAGKEGWGGGERQPRVDRAGGSPRQGLEHPAVGVDDCAHAGRSRADDRDAFFRGAKAGLGEMLRRAPASEPRIVRRVEDEIRPVPAVHDLARKDDFVAKLEPDLAPPRQVERARAWTGVEIDFTGRQSRQ